MASALGSGPRGREFKSHRPDHLFPVWIVSRTWRNWQTRYFEVVVPNGVQVQVLPCAPIQGLGVFPGPPEKEVLSGRSSRPSIDWGLPVFHRSLTVFDCPFRETAWKRPGPIKHAPHVLRPTHRGRPVWNHPSGGNGRAPPPEACPNSRDSLAKAGGCWISERDVRLGNAPQEPNVVPPSFEAG